MSPHRAVIEAGPGAIRRLCCGADVVADTAVSAAALAAIDDQVALLDERPVAVDSLWFDALRSLAVGGPSTVLRVRRLSGRGNSAVLSAAAYLAAAAVLVVPTVALAVPWLTQLQRLFIA